MRCGTWNDACRAGPRALDFLQPGNMAVGGVISDAAVPAMFTSVLPATNVFTALVHSLDMNPYCNSRHRPAAVQILDAGGNGGRVCVLPIVLVQQTGAFVPCNRRAPSYVHDGSRMRLVGWACIDTTQTCRACAHVITSKCNTVYMLGTLALCATPSFVPCTWAFTRLHSLGGWGAVEL